MKIKNYILAMMLVVGAVSCTSDDAPLSQTVGEETPVEFGIYTSAINTGGQGVRATSLAEADVKASGIGIFAIHQGKYGLEDYLESQRGYMPNFMYNQQLTFVNAQTPAWVYSPIKYWPNNPGDKVSFFAYAPYNANLGTNNVVTPDNNLALHDVVPVDGYRLQLGYDHMGPGIEYFMSNDPTEGVDLMWGANQGTNPAVCPFDLTKPGVTNKIQFQMKHALSRMDFDVKVWTNAVAGVDANNAIPDGTTVKVKRVSLKGNFAGRGTLRLYDGTWNRDIASYRYLTFKEGQLNPAITAGLAGDATKTDALPLLNGVPATTVTPPAVKNNYIMAIPGARFYFEIEYDVITTDANNPENCSTMTNIVRSTDSNAGHTNSADGWYEIAQGKAYMYHLTIGLRTIQFDATYTDWVDKPQTDIYLQ